MGNDETNVTGLAVALAVGVLIGIDRERRKGAGPGRGAAGLRTFALVGLLGGLALFVGGVAVAAVALGFVGLAALAGYVRSDQDDPGLTTEVALVAVFLLGALSVRDPTLGAGLGVATAVLLASRDALHRFVRSAMTAEELHDLLLLAAGAAIVWPLLPDRQLGPAGVLNPRDVWRLVLLVMGIGGFGHVAVRLAGARAGLPVAGLAGGFISSAATIGSMGATARSEPSLARAAVAGAVLSTVATILQMVAVVGSGNLALLRELALPFAAAGLTAALFAGLAAARVPRTGGVGRTAGKPFSLAAAIVFAAIVSSVLVASALLNDVAGEGGVFVSAAVGGFADAHAAGGSVATLSGRGDINLPAAELAVLLALTANTVTKLVAAFGAGGRGFGLAVSGGLLAVLATLWGGWAAAAAAGL